LGKVKRAGLKMEERGPQEGTKRKKNDKLGKEE